MEIGRWWREALSARERTAVITMVVFIIGMSWWYGVTRPLLDRREALLRTRDALLKRARELAPGLRRAMNARDTIAAGRFSAAPDILPFLERRLVGVASLTQGPMLFPAEVVAGGKRLSAAQVRFRDLEATPWLQIISEISSAGVQIGEFEWSVDAQGKGISGYVNLWRKIFRTVD
ncbi:MAG: hypothetical protein WA705_28140 [Candidatus Ozemobacteraceae bacterium]